MTTKTYAITEANKRDLIEWLRGGHIQRVLNAIENLTPKSLPLITGEPVAYRLPDPDVAKKHHYFDCDEVVSVKHVLETLYASPQPKLQPITADDVTDEMHETFDKTFMPYGPDREIMAAAYNAVIKHKGDTK